MNPIPAIQYPDWLHKRIKADENKFKQKDIKHFFKVATKPNFEVEDLHTMGVIDASKAQQIQQQKKQKEEANRSKEKYSKIQDCPDPSVNGNFKEWFKYQKQNWRNIRRNFKENKQIVHQNDRSNTNQVSRGLSSFIRNMDDVILNSNWHIISIENTFEPGIMKLWAVTENSHMFAIKLRIPRIIYINSKEQKNQMDKNFRKANNKILPRNRKTYHLYEWEGPEETYQDNYMSYNYLLDNNIEGIYETQMPLKFRAIYELGCVIRPRKNKIPTNEQAQGRVYSISELETIKQSQLVENPYMPSQTYEKICLI
jgi:DNA polymerase epsilon subunit 1